MRRIVFLLLFTASLPLFVSDRQSLQAGDKIYVGQKTFTRGRSMDAIDHAPYDVLLTKYVDDSGNVNYDAWKASADDMKVLDAYLASLSSVDTSARSARNAQLAYWINAYNAVTIKGILREYPTTSIRNHTAKLYGYNIWHDLLLYSGGSAYSLDTIEHKILRPAKEPRIHFAIVCASKSCPKLLNRAYTAGELETQLVQNTRDFFANAGNFRYDASKSRLELSSILQWFADDFGDSKAKQLATIGPYLPTAEARRAAAAGSVSVSYLDYDWSLNEQSR